MSPGSFETISNYRLLKKDVLYPFDDSRLLRFPELNDEIVEKRILLNGLIERLDDLTVRDINQCKNNLLQSIDKVLELTAGNKLGYPLSRDQGLGISNYIFGKVLGILEGAVNSPLGYGWPQFYYEKDGDFDATELRRLLSEFRTNLAHSRFATYLDFEAFYEDYENRIKGLWEQEDLRRR